MRDFIVVNNILNWRNRKIGVVERMEYVDLN